ncbi:unnamed protein product [Discula destructiva]
MSLAQFEAEKQEYEKQLAIVAQSLSDDPENAELLGLKSELDEMLGMINSSIAELAPASTKHIAPSAPARAPSPPPPAPEKWSRENHPAFKKQAQAEKERTEAVAAAVAEAPVNYAVNDTVLAKWVTGDKGFYPARIMSVTGSSTQPIYTVKFKSYDEVETLRARDIKPATNKRKADGPSASAGGAVASPLTPGTPSFPATGSNDGIVLTGAPSVYPQAADDKAGEEKPAKKFKKIKATKELEKGKNAWQNFTAKGKVGKVAKKDSMFRTPDGAHGRVGFTGSGQPMRKDPTRSRHIYQPNEDVD